MIELIEAALRDRGLRVLGTLDAFEAAEVVRRLKVDLLVISRGHLDVAEGLPELQRGVAAVVLNVEPMGPDEIAEAVITALPPVGNTRESSLRAPLRRVSPYPVE